MSEISRSRVEAFLSRRVTPPPTPSGNLIFALDATASREQTWDKAAQLQSEMFREAALIGGLHLQLVYYRGMAGVNAECRASKWADDPITLAKWMGKIRCESGLTQIGRVLAHAVREADQRKINAVIFVGDAAEELREQLHQPARRLGGLEVPVFMFQEGHDPEAQACFRELAELTRGAYCRFDQSSARQLGELLRAVAMFAVGGVVALEKQGSAAARLLLGQLKG